MLCSESSLRSHLLLQQLDSFEIVLNDLIERYYNICFDELNATSRITKQVSHEHDRQSQYRANEDLAHGRKNDNSGQNNVESSSARIISQHEKVRMFCNFLLSSIDRNGSSSSIDSEYFFLRYVLIVIASYLV